MELLNYNFTANALIPFDLYGRVWEAGSKLFDGEHVGLRDELEDYIGEEVYEINSGW